MTKAVRIENADNSDRKLMVYVEVINAEGIWVRLEGSYPLNHPTSMLTETVWEGKRLVVEEIC